MLPGLVYYRSGLPGYDTQAAGHLQVASAIRAGLAGAGIASEPAVRAYGLAFVPLASTCGQRVALGRLPLPGELTDDDRDG
jgi:molybdate-binding protein